MFIFFILFILHSYYYYQLIIINTMTKHWYMKLLKLLKNCTAFLSVWCQQMQRCCFTRRQRIIFCHLLIKVAKCNLKLYSNDCYNLQRVQVENWHLPQIFINVLLLQLINLRYESNCYQNLALVLNHIVFQVHFVRIWVIFLLNMTPGFFFLNFI